MVAFLENEENLPVVILNEKGEYIYFANSSEVEKIDAVLKFVFKGPLGEWLKKINREGTPCQECVLIFYDIHGGLKIGARDMIRVLEKKG